MVSMIRFYDLYEKEMARLGEAPRDDEEGTRGGTAFAADACNALRCRGGELDDCCPPVDPGNRPKSDCPSVCSSGTLTNRLLFVGRVLGGSSPQTAGR